MKDDKDLDSDSNDKDNIDDRDNIDKIDEYNVSGKKINDKDRRQIARALGLVTQLGLSMASCVLIGVLLGRFLDSLFETSPLFLIIFSFIGAGSGIKAMYDIANKWK